MIVPPGWDGRLIAYDYYNSPFGHRFKVLNEPWDASEVTRLYEYYTIPRADGRDVVRYKLAIRIG